VSGRSAARLRVGVVGVGIGVHYAEAFGRVDEADVVALCASSERTVVPAARGLAIPGVYTDFGEMLAREQLDVVAIATPNDLHHPMTLAALRAGAHVLCDKPLAMDVGQAQEMLDEAEERGRRTVVPFWWRFLPVVARAHKLISDGSFGEPFFAEFRYLNCGWGDPFGPMRWQFDTARAGSGALGNVGSHVIHVMQWLLGDVTEVSAHTVVNVPERRWPDGREARPDGEDTVAFVGTLENGAPVSLLASSAAHEVRSSFGGTLHFSRGSVNFYAESHWPSGSRGALTVMRARDDAPQPVDLDDGAAVLAPQDAAYTLIAGELIAAIREDRPAAPGFAEGLRVQRVIDAVLRSARERRWLPVEEVAACA
jgi:predicted dehydrogenase